MQVNTTTASTAKQSAAKTTAKSRAPKKSAKEKETLHLKDKQLEKVPSTMEVMQMIATAAYFRAAQRGFQPGHELEDWLHAEHQIRDTYQC